MKSKKRLRVVEFTILLSVILACLLSIGSAFAEKPTVKTVGQIVLVDSRGKIVGNAEFISNVWLKIGERLIGVSPTKDGLFMGTAYYTLPNCQGTLFVQPDSSSRFPGQFWGGAIAPPGSTVYVPHENVVPSLVAYQSFYTDGQCFSRSDRIEAVPGEALTDLDTVFAPPFRVRTTP